MLRIVVLFLLLTCCSGHVVAQSTPDLRADMCLGDTATMAVSVSNADSLQWYKNGVAIAGANNDTLLAFEGGAYFVRAFIGDGRTCTDESGNIRIIINYPYAHDDYMLVPLGKVAPLAVLLNDQPNCAPFDKGSLHIVTQPSLGIIARVENGIVQYKPPPTLLGVDKFTYAVTDTEGRVTNEAVVSVELFVDCAVLYPNPVENRLQVTVDNKKIRALKVYDGAGRALYQTVVEENNLTVDMSSFPQGIYMVELVGYDGPGCMVKIQKK